MLSFVFELALCLNPLPYLVFLRKFVMAAKTIANVEFGIINKSLLSVIPSNLTGYHILFFAFEFEWPIIIMKHLEFTNEFSVVSNSFQNDNIINKLQMNL
jgi:hypothetical protein